MASTSTLNLQSKATLNNGKEIPHFGLGVYQSSPGESTYNSVLWALKEGVRHIDTAKLYSNEEDVGRAVRDSGIPREEIFVTTKLWDSDHGYESSINAGEKSLKKLGLDYIDLYIIHSPNPGPAKRSESWKGLEKLVADGKVKSIGVSNYGVKHLKELLASNPKVLPTINQVEIHPWLTRNDIVKYCEENKIVVEAYSPLTRGKKLKDPVLLKIAEKYKKSPAQILIRWGLERNFVVLPKSVHKERIIENTQVYDFKLDQEDIETLNAQNKNYVTGWDPTVAP